MVVKYVRIEALMFAPVAPKASLGAAIRIKARKISLYSASDLVHLLE